MKFLNRIRCINALDLKLLAMTLMLCDHLWATIIPGAQWLTNLGRLAFPIFAFQIAEGYSRTHSFRNYLGRIFLFALISEIPFNLMYGGTAFFPLHQNVMFTFVLALVLIRFLDWCRQKNRWLFIAMIPVTLLAAFTLGFATFVDYYGFGVVTVLLFWLTRELKIKGLRVGWLIQLAGLYWINVELMGGLTIPLEVLGHHFDLTQQGFALLALIPIWLYNGRQGPHSRAIQYACYAFYPVHILVLAILALYVL